MLFAEFLRRSMFPSCYEWIVPIIKCSHYGVGFLGGFPSRYFGAILFRRENIHLIEPHESENSLQTWVCIGNLQRMVWIKFANTNNRALLDLAPGA